MKCVVAFFCVCAAILVVKGNGAAENCYSSVVCTDDGNTYKTHWKMILPRPQCNVVSTTNHLGRLNQKFNETLEQFKRDLNKIAAKNAGCSMCKPPSSESPSTDSILSKCYVPVICNASGDQSEVNWLQIYSTCDEGSTKEEIEKMFNSMRKEAYKKLSIFNTTTCGMCALNKVNGADAIKDLKNARFSPENLSSVQSCYAAVVCSDGKSTPGQLSWKKIYSRQSCSAGTGIGLSMSGRALNRFKSLLQEVIKVL